uniref:Uncharacterized protein n=1 Tax=Siphoviridae sp. ctEIp38 TaxID=2825394 RepID=A0A8S5QDE4_9CAUD|nr:MAG TPA: hypothetical protein [Siphoviridae sp. ctEIp38]
MRFSANIPKSRLRGLFLAKEIYFSGKTIYFFVWRCAIFFYSLSPRCVKLRGFIFNNIKARPPFLAVGLTVIVKYAL